MTYSPILRNQFFICRCMKLLKKLLNSCTEEEAKKIAEKVFSLCDKQDCFCTARRPEQSQRCSKVQIDQFPQKRSARIFFDVQVLNVQAFLNVQVQKIDQFPPKRSVRVFLCQRPQAVAGWSLGYWQIVGSRGPPSSHHPQLPHTRPGLFDSKEPNDSSAS